MGENWLTDLKEGVEALLASYFDEKRRGAPHLAAEAVELVEAVESLTMRGGKRFRAALLHAGQCSVVPETPLAQSLEAGAAMELLQSYLLIHDDWMDQDDQRRGGPAIHRMLADTRRDAHLGASLAILAGDLASTYAWELLTRKAPEARLPQILKAFIHMQEEVLFGQHLDLTHSADVARMHALKTSSYTVVGPLLVGAAFAGGNEAQREALIAFGRPIGIAFQLRDDLLGTFGDAAATGKPAGNDLRQGKRNGVTEAARVQLSGEALEKFEAVFGKADAAQAEVDAVVALLAERGVQSEIETALEADYDAALTALEAPCLAATGRDALVELAKRLAHRSY